ncbi:MAG TPA: hypothetical protein VG488_11725 [Candidatus Angelobacter sp.]|jgi:hypothetical protein|nr:hypothetical protein [Candidatus Angelobacter sp.]
MPDEICIPLGFIKGKVTVENMPKELKNVSVNITAHQIGGMPTGVAVAPGEDYAIPVQPGQYDVTAKFGNAEMEVTEVIVANGQSQHVDFCFGKEPK